MPYGGVFMRLATETEWDGFTAVPDEFVASGSTVVARGTYSGAYEATGKSLKAPFVHVWHLQDSHILNFRQYTDTALVQQALR